MTQPDIDPTIVFLTRIARSAKPDSAEEVNAALAVDLIEQDYCPLENWPAARMFVTRVLKQHNYTPKESDPKEGK